MRKNHARFLPALLVFCSLGCIYTAQAQSYGGKLDLQWRSVLGLQAQDGEFRWFSYPTGNLGVMTLYRVPPGQQPTDADRICATWSCFGVDPAKIPADEYRFTTIKGYAAVGLRTPFELTHSKEGSTAINLLLSNLFHALSIEGAVDVSRAATVDLRAGEIYRRTLNLSRFRDFLESSTDPLIRDARNQGDITCIGADIVARSLELTVDTENDPQLAAQLIQAAARLGDGASGIRISRLWRQTYVVRFPEFFVLATQMRHLALPRANGAIGSIAGSAPQFQTSAAFVPIPEANPQPLRASTGE